MEGIPRPGQFAVTKTGGWGAKVIQVVTASKVNHALVCVSGTGSDATCVEAEPKGARYTTAGMYPDAIWSDFDLTDQEIEDICSWAEAHIGAKYGWLDCVAAGFDTLHKRFWWFPEFLWVAKKLEKESTMDCSQLVTMDYTNAGLALCPGMYACQVSPQNLAEALISLKSSGKTRPPYSEGGSLVVEVASLTVD